MHLATAKRPLSDAEVGVLATSLDCTIGYVGKVLGMPRWDYTIDKGTLSDGEREIIMRLGLRIYDSSD